MSPSGPTIGLVGCGRMGGAMARRWIASGSIEFLHIFDTGGIDGDLGTRQGVFAHNDFSSFSTVLDGLDLIVLAVKPQGMDSACAALAPILPAQTAVLSIAAGKTIPYFRRLFASSQPVVRAMPNTPALIGKGMTVAVASERVREESRDICDRLLSALGKVVWIGDECLMDAVTALSGSGPAYLFYLTEAMAEAGRAAGLPDDLALLLARETIVGAAALMEEDAAVPPARLRENVTSPNGTTAAALEVLMDGRLRSIMTEAVLRAAQRGRDLAE